MILVGKNITSNTDELKKIDLSYLYMSLRQPKAEIASKIRQLRIIHGIDYKQYSALKRQLPYIVCGIFNPLIRKKENFAYIEYFILDIDNLSSKDLCVETIRTKIEKDERVVMCFTSPSEDGLKIIFKLKERCYDSGFYSLFYKAFVKNFSIQYSLEQVIDNKTSDVSRACFISIDELAYYNETAETIDIKQYIDDKDPEMLFSLKHEFDVSEKNIAKEDRKEPKVKNEIEEEILDKIKQKLNPNVKIKTGAENAYVPKQIEEISEELKSYIEETGMEIMEMRGISYGKKIRAKIGLKMAEVNIFYGKKGFTVIKSPKNGTTDELNDILMNLIESFIVTKTI